MQCNTPYILDFFSQKSIHLISRNGGSTKDEARYYFKVYKAEVENQLEKKIKRICSDHGGEYFSSEFDFFCAEHDIIHERTSPYSPQSNGGAGQKNRTLTDTSGLSKAWWGRLY